MHKRAVSIAQARIGIVSNNEKLITESRYFEGQVLESLLTNIHSIQPIPYTNDLDAYFVAIDDPSIPPHVKVTEKVLFATGDFSRYERECSDNRYSLFGNLGLFFKYLIDFIKLTFGTSAFIDLDYLAEKTEMVKDAGIYICPGGTFLEVSVWQGTYTKYLKRCKELGFNAIEVSDGTIEIDMKTRADCIKRAVDMGFKVVSEVGKKDPSEAIAAKIMHEEIAADLANGAFKVIVEAREAGKGVGIYDKDGKPKLDEVEAIIKGVDDITKLEWEAPIKNQQEFLILRFGVNVSLGNVPPDDILALEALRNGLRGDTLKRAFMANPKYHKK